MRKTSADIHVSGPPISWRTDLIGVLGVTLLVAVLLWPTLDGSRTLMSDSWRLNYPWAVEGSVAEEESASRLGLESAQREAREPYILEYDIYLEALPWYAFAQSEIRSGRWPHWNPHAFCGAPLYANHLVPLTHPPLLIALLVAPVQQIHTLATFLTWWLAGIGLYLYLRTRRLQPTACLAASALYLTSGHYMPLVPFQMAGLMYYPWLIWASDSLERRGSVCATLPLAMLLGLQLAAGHPAFVAPFVYLLVLHRALIWGFSRKPLRWWAPRLGLIFLALVLGGAISAVQNYPTWSYFQQTPRHLAGQTVRTLNPDSESSEDAQGVPAEPGESLVSKVAIILSPVFQRVIMAEHPYVGAPLLLLAILGLIAYRPPPERSAMVALVIVFSLLAAPPIFARVGVLLPGLGISPFNPYAPAQFLLVLLAGIGANELMSPARQREKRLHVITLILAFIGAIVFALPLLYRELVDPDTRWEREQTGLAAALLIVGVIACLLPAVALWFRGRKPAIGGFILPLGLTIAGVLGHFYQYPVFQRVPVMPDTPSIRALPRSDTFRVIRHSSKPTVHAGSSENPLTFGGNLPMWAGMNDSQGYDSFVIEGQWDILRALDPHSLAWNGLAFPITQPGALSSPLLDAMAVKWVISDDPDLLSKPESGMEANEWRLTHDGGLVIYERENATPRWYFAERAVGVEDFEGALRALAERGLADDARRARLVVIETSEAVPDGLSPVEIPETTGEEPSGKVELASGNPQELVFAVEAESGGYFVLSDAWFPEWRADVDGEEVEILRANAAYRAVRVEAGRHEVRFRYEPRSFRVGVAVSLGAIVLLLLGCMIERAVVLRERTKHRGSPY